MRQGREIRVVAVGGLGDCLILTAFLPTLARQPGRGRVKIITTADGRALFETNPHVDAIDVVSPDRLPLHTIPDPRWDLFSPYMTGEMVDHQGRPNVTLHFPMKANLRSVSVIGQIAEQTGVAAAAPRPVLHVTDDDRGAAASCLDEVGLGGGEEFLVVAPGTGPGREKRWPSAHWRYACERIGEVLPLLLLGDDAGDPLPGVIRLSRTSAIRTSAAILGRSRGFFSVDTFLPHLAASVGVRGAVLFGPSDEVAFGYPDNLNLCSDVDCRPCGDTARRRACEDNICMQTLDSEEVVDRFLVWLDAR